jgi:hypothetical protein
MPQSIGWNMKAMWPRQRRSIIDHGGSIIGKNSDTRASAQGHNGQFWIAVGVMGKPGPTMQITVEAVYKSFGSTNRLKQYWAAQQSHVVHQNLDL